MQAMFNGTVLAESDDIVMVDGNPYFREAMRVEFFLEINPQHGFQDGKEPPVTGMWW